MIPSIPLKGLVVRIVQFLDNSTTTGERLDRPPLVHANQTGVIAAHIVRKLASPRAQGGRDYFR